MRFEESWDDDEELEELEQIGEDLLETLGE